MMSTEHLLANRLRHLLPEMGPGCKVLRRIFPVFTRAFTPWSLPIATGTEAESSLGPRSSGFMATTRLRRTPTRIQIQAAVMTGSARSTETSALHDQPANSASFGVELQGNT